MEGLGESDAGINEEFLIARSARSEEEYARQQRELAEEELRISQIFASRVKTFQHPGLSIGGPRIVAGTDPDESVCLALAHEALSNTRAKKRSKPPRKWLPRSTYAGVMVLVDREPPPQLMEQPRKVASDAILVAQGWIERVQVRDGQEVSLGFTQDPDRRLEIRLLELLAEDPMARMTLQRYHSQMGGLPGPVRARILGE